MQEPVKKALMLILGEEIETKDVALERLNIFLTEKGLPDLGINDLRILIETAAVFASVPVSEIVTQEFKNSFEKKKTYYDILDKPVEFYEQRFLNSDGNLITHVALTTTKRMLRPKEKVRDQKYFKPIQKLIETELPELKVCFLKYGATIARLEGRPVVTFDKTFDFRGEMFGIVNFHISYSLDDVLSIIPLELREHKAIFVDSKTQAGRAFVTLRPCNVPDFLEILKLLY